MATFTWIQINGDHIADCDPEALGHAVKLAAANPYNFKQFVEGHGEIGRALSIIQTEAGHSWYEKQDESPLEVIRRLNNDCIRGR